MVCIILVFQLPFEYCSGLWSWRSTWLGPLLVLAFFFFLSQQSAESLLVWPLTQDLGFCSPATGKKIPATLGSLWQINPYSMVRLLFMEGHFSLCYHCLNVTIVQPWYVLDRLQVCDEGERFQWKAQLQCYFLQIFFLLFLSTKSCKKTKPSTSLVLTSHCHSGTSHMVNGLVL